MGFNTVHYGLITSCFQLPCGFHIPFEMWIVILKRRDYLEDTTINGRIEMHLEGIVLGCVDCTVLALSRQRRCNVQKTLNKPHMQ